MLRGDRGDKVSQGLLKREEVGEWDQSSQVDLLAESEIFDSGSHSAKGGSGSMAPQEILKNGSSSDVFSSFPSF